MRRVLLVVVLVAGVGAALWFVALRDDEPEPAGEGTVVSIEAEPHVCWESLLDDGRNPLAEPRREADCGSRQLILGGDSDRTVVVSNIGESGTLTVNITVNGRQTARGSTSEPRGTITLEP